MRSIKYALGLVVLPLVLAPAETAYARPFRVAQIPNGSVNGCANCHVNATVGGARNPFGTRIEQAYLSTPGPAGNVLWGLALATENSDGDGAANGTELQDPGGTWAIGQPAPGDPSRVTRPGTFDVALVPVPALTEACQLLLTVLLLGGGLHALRRSQPDRARPPQVG